MSSILISFILISLLLSSCSCWVFNNVNYEHLRAKSVDMDIEDFDNEIDLDDFEQQQKFALIFPGK